MIIINLIQNIALLVALAATYQVIGSRFKQNIIGNKILSGLLFGGVSIVGMMTPLHFMPGIIFDGRSIILSISGLFGGPVVAVIAATMCGAYRLWLGGAGAWVGFSVILEAAALGVLFYFLWKRTARQISAVSLWIFGLLVHVVMLALMLALPGGVGPEVLRQVGLPVLMIYPLATMVVCQIFLDYERQFRDREALRQSEEKYRGIFDNSIMGIYQSTPDGRYIAVNPAYARMFGFGSPEEMVSDVTDIGSQLYANAADREEVKRRFAGPVPLVNYEVECRRKDGTRIWGSMNAHSVRDESGRILYYEGMTQEITSRKNAEQALQRSEALLKEAQRVAHIGHWEIDITTRTSRWSEELFHISGLDPARGEPSLDAYQELTHPDDWDLLRASATNAATQGIPFDIEFRCIRPDKSVQWINAKGYPTQKREGKFFGMFGTAQDITERKTADEALRASETVLNSVIDQSPYPMFISDHQGTLVRTNKALRDLLQISDEEVVGKYNVLRDNIVEEQGFLPLVKSVFERGETVRFELNYDSSELKHIQVGQSTVVILDVTIFPIKDSSGKIANAVCQHIDITYRKQAQEALRESEERYRSLFEAAGDGIFVLETEEDHRSRILSVNRAAAEMHGYTVDELLTLTMFDLETPECTAALEPVRNERFFSGEVIKEEVTHRKKDGTLFCVESTARMLDLGDRKCVLAIYRDVTWRKRAEEALQESEQKYRSVVENMQDVLYRTDMQGTITMVSPSGPGMIGVESVEQIIGLNVARDFYKNPEERDRLLATLREKGEVRNYEVELVRRDGNSIIVSTSSHIYHDKSGKPLGVEGVFTDITARKQAENALRESEEKYRIVVQNANEAIFVAQDGVIRFLNSKTAETIGYGQEELISKPFTEFVHPDDRELVLQSHFRRLEGEEFPSRYPFRILNKDGHVRWVEIAVARIPWERRPAVLIFMTDITERRQMEAALKESEEWYRSIVEESFDGIFVQKGPEIIFANSRLYEMLGYSEGELEHMDHWLIYHPDYQEIVRERARARMRGEIFSHEYEVKLQRKDGSHFDGEVNARAVTVEGEPGVRVWVRDVSKRKRLEEVQRRLATAIEQAGEAIVITDARGNVEYVNPAHERITGYTRDEVVGSPPPLFKDHELDPERRRNLSNSMAGGEAWSGRVVGQRKDGTLCEMDVTISPVRDPDGRVVNRVGVERDITEEVRLQKQLLQAQKMEAIGTLSGGIAHDFNNLLTVVMGFSELLLGEKEQDHPEYADLQKIFDAAKNGAELVQRLLMFSRKTEPKPILMNLNRQIVRVEKLLRRTIPRMIDIRLDLSSDLPEINADPSQIEQVLMNLALNARDAMPDVGKLTVRTDVVTLDEAYCGVHVDVKPGEYVALEMSDTGHGMSKETLEHIFEPFFTTKEMGRGTGLGLAMVYGIVTQHNGHIAVYSEVGKGTTFRVYLPAVPADVELEVEDSGITPAFGTETVLLVDDEELVRELGARILTKYGYTVLQARSGKDALDLFKRERPHISLVVLDLIMPEMGGKECLQEMLKVDPKVRVLVASGFSAEASVRECMETGAKGFVPKPFRVREMLREVRKVLDKR